MDPISISDRHELEQAHQLLDQYCIERADVDTMMMLSLKGRIELLLKRIKDNHAELV